MGLSPRKLIICADDFGLTPEISQAILHLAQHRKISAISCMVNYPAFPQYAAQLRNLHPQLFIGLHFNLKQSIAQLIIRSYLRILKKDNIAQELQRQINNFHNTLGFSPDFIDGHQHIHQLPMIRDILIQQCKKLTPTPWVRNCYNLQSNFKAQLINMLGAHKMRSLLQQHAIAHNLDFSGIYNFQEATRYPQLFTEFVQQIQNNGLLMCHPGLSQRDAFRNLEFNFFNSEQYLKILKYNKICLDFKK